MQSPLKYILIVLACAFAAAASGQGVKITEGPYLQAVAENEATIVWTTNKDAISWVELAPAGTDHFYSLKRDPYYETAAGVRSIGRLHRVKVTGLTKGTEYRYRVFSKEVVSFEGKRALFGDIASSNVYKREPFRFKTLDRGKESVNFAMVNDIHEKGDTLKALLNYVKFGSSDLVFFNGDMVNTAESEEQLFDAFMKSAVKSFASEVPVFFSRGNHETRGKFSKNFMEYFPSTTGKNYYTVRQGPVCFIVLDSGEDKPDTDIEYSELAAFDAYRSEQAQWLQKVVASEEFTSATFRVVVMHIPPYGTDWHGAQDIKQKFVPILNRANIDIMLCGHMHQYIYFKPIEGELNFPVYLNANNSSVVVNANRSEMVISRKDANGKTLNTHKISR